MGRNLGNEIQHREVHDINNHIEINITRIFQKTPSMARSLPRLQMPNIWVSTLIANLHLTIMSTLSAKRLATPLHSYVEI